MIIPSTLLRYFLNISGACGRSLSKPTAFNRLNPGELFTPEATLDPAQRQAVYTDIQELWAQEFPTLDLTQEPRIVISLPKIANARIDAMGLLHYELLTKNQ